MAGKRKPQSRTWRRFPSDLRNRHQTRILYYFILFFGHNQATFSIHFADFQSSLPAVSGPVRPHLSNTPEGRGTVCVWQSVTVRNIALFFPVFSQLP